MEKIAEDRYRVLASSSQGEYKEKGSKFLSYAFPVTSLEEFEMCMEEVKGIHPKARHYCYAYRIGIHGDVYRANDDGEPSGTAGKPILGQLLSHNVSDAFIVVVRYFGGTKLGASGLINAYKLAAHYALENAEIKTKTLNFNFRLSFSYGEMGHVMNVTKSLGYDILKKVFEETPYIVLQIPQSEAHSALIKLKARLLQISEEQVTEETEVPFCKIEKLAADD